MSRKLTIPTSISTADVSNKTILFRTDLNVPIKDGIVTDTTRIDRASLEITALAARGAKVVIISHFGRPKGITQPDMSLAAVAAPLARAVGRPVAFASDCIGPPARKVIDAAHGGEVVLLENLRFHYGEEANDKTFAAALAEHADLYVNDAFSASHRAHASIVGVTAFLPSYAGGLMMEELEALDHALGNPVRPVIAVVGGAKVSTKIDVLVNLIDKVDHLIVGGGMANTFLAAKGYAIGASLAELSLISTAKSIMEAATTRGCDFILPEDGVVATQLEQDAPHRVARFDTDAIADNEMILDAGPQSIAEAKKLLEGGKTIVWNGPMGAFETKPFDLATVALAKHAAGLTAKGELVSVAGGGDTVAALNCAGATEKFSYVSTAGGAFLEWLEGKTLPGCEALLAKNNQE